MLAVGQPNKTLVMPSEFLVERDTLGGIYSSKARNPVENNELMTKPDIKSTFIYLLLI